MHPAEREVATRRVGHRHSFLRSTSGATTVEFALIVSVLIVLLFAVIEFGIAAFRRNVANEGARYGARFAMVRGSTSGRPTSQTEVQTEVRARISESRVNVGLTYPDGNSNAPGMRVNVTVAYPDTLRITRLFPAFAVSASAQSVIVY